jgi:hypothetical protein
MEYLSFELSEGDDGVMTLEAMASTRAAQHGQVMSEVAQVLHWAQSAFPHTRGPADDGMDWDHDLQVQEEQGGWHTVSLTFSGSRRFAEAFLEAFGEAP